MKSIVDTSEEKKRPAKDRKKERMTHRDGLNLIGMFSLHLEIIFDA